MNKLFCDVCKQITRCNYCSKYGPFGVYMYMENEWIKKKKRERKEWKGNKEAKIINDTIDMIQLYTYMKANNKDQDLEYLESCSL